jgi:catechol 2,3-dioxygenase-like lactoylglutathione lyase family enzyme
MTISAENAFAYHIGIVVRNLEETTRLYSEMLGVPRWHRWEVEREGLPVNPATAGHKGKIAIAYGRAPGQTIELLQPVSGTSIWSEYLREHGEGVQHIGLWTADLAGAVAEGMARGGRVVHGMLREGGGSVQLSAASAPDAVVQALDPNMIAYIMPTIGGVQIEYVGLGMLPRMRETIGEGFDDVIASPPWLSRARS